MSHILHVYSTEMVKKSDVDVLMKNETKRDMIDIMSKIQDYLDKDYSSNPVLSGGDQVMCRCSTSWNGWLLTDWTQ